MNQKDGKHLFDMCSICPRVYPSCDSRGEDETDLMLSHSRYVSFSRGVKEKNRALDPGVSQVLQTL